MRERLVQMQAEELPVGEWTESWSSERGAAHHLANDARRGQVWRVRLSQKRHF
jgi:hypothetical protein